MQGTLIDDSQVDAELNQLVAEANKPFGPFRHLARTQAVMSNDQAAGTYVFVGGGVSATAAYAAGGTAVELEPILIAAADLAVTNRTTQLRVRAGVTTNGTVPAITFTFGLYPVTSSGGADALTLTPGTVVASSTVAIASPVANDMTTAVSSAFSLPADGDYLLGVVTSGTLTNNNVSLLTAQLQQRWT